MIKKEEIKEGLEFILPYDDFKDEEDEKEYICRLARYGFEGIRFWKDVFYTKIPFNGEEGTLVTAKRPVFEVVGFKNDSVFVMNNVSRTTDDAFIFIDLSFVEKFGEKAMKSKKNQKRKRRNKRRDRTTVWDMPSLDKCSIHLDSAIENNKPCNVKKEGNEDADCSLNFLDKAIDSWAIEALCNDSLRKCIESINLYLKEVHPGEDKSEAGSEKEDADRFKEITDKMLETYKSKNKDYGDSFRNLFKECGMTYAYGHLKEKLERVKSLMSDEAKVKGESMKDSLYDLANYAILTIMEIEHEEGR